MTILCYLTHFPLKKWPPFRRRYFQMHFHEWKFGISVTISPKFVPKGLIDNNPGRVGLDNGLVPNRRQAIIWTNADPIHWRIYAALRGDELTANLVFKTSIYGMHLWLRGRDRLTSVWNVFFSVPKFTLCFVAHKQSNTFTVVCYYWFYSETWIRHEFTPMCRMSPDINMFVIRYIWTRFISHIM